MAADTLANMSEGRGMEDSRGEDDEEMRLLRARRRQELGAAGETLVSLSMQRALLAATGMRKWVGMHGLQRSITPQPKTDLPQCMHVPCRQPSGSTTCSAFHKWWKVQS